MTDGRVGAAAPILAAKANGQTPGAPPKVSAGAGVELENMDNDQVKLPLHEDIMQLSRLGEIGPIQKLFEENKFSAKHEDNQGITPLHWAAINNHFALCKFLIESGADVNAKGGDAVATPAMWAAQRCNYYIVYLLLQHGADPLLTDAQGYNILHLATFDGNVFLLVLLLHQGIPIDSPDPQGHTSLMWAAYKGYPACVDLFLRWDASVNATDENGFTALHWALVKGSQACIQKLIEYGSDRFVETSTQKTPAKIASEMQSMRAWRRALADCGCNQDGNPKTVPIFYSAFVKQRAFLSRFLFVIPFAVIYIVISILSGVVIFAAVPLAVFAVYATQWATQQMLVWAPANMKHLHRTPYLAGVFAGTCFWVGIQWLTKILPNTYKSNPFQNFIFAILYSLCAYFYTYSMTEDPGFVPKSGSRSQQKAVIEELLTLWKFDDTNFCIQCMTRMPLRSKHCKRCGRCVAKHDHHCPWINNCVGSNNLRHFFLYVLFMAFGILMFIRLVFAHLQNLPPPKDSQCNILSESLCKIVLPDTFTVVLTIWSAMQLTWVTMLLVVQLVQISRAVTTYESMKGHAVHDSPVSEAVTAALTTGAPSMSGGQLTATGMGPDPLIPPAHSHNHPHKEGFLSQWKKLLGLDTFVATAQSGLDSSHRPNSHRNPFSRGIITNCRDFWCDSSPYFGQRETGAAMLGGESVNYARMYETPSRMKMRRPQGDGNNTLYHSVGDDDVV